MGRVGEERATSLKASQHRSSCRRNTRSPDQLPVAEFNRSDHLTGIVDRHGHACWRPELAAGMGTTVPAGVDDDAARPVRRHVTAAAIRPLSLMVIGPAAEDPKLPRFVQRAAAVQEVLRVGRVDLVEGTL